MIFLLQMSNLKIPYLYTGHLPTPSPSISPCRAHKDMYHALGYSTFLFLQAILTFDPVSIEISELGSDNMSPW